MPNHKIKRYKLKKLFIRQQGGATSNIKQVVTGFANSLVLLEDGTVYVCGTNEHGQLGQGLEKSTILNTFTKIILNEKEKVVYVTLLHTSIILATASKLLIAGTLKCPLNFIGDGEFEQVDLSATITGAIIQIIIYDVMDTIVVLTDAGRVYECYMANTETQDFVPINLPRIKKMITSHVHLIFLTTDNKLFFKNNMFLRTLHKVFTFKNNKDPFVEGELIKFNTFIGDIIKDIAIRAKWTGTILDDTSAFFILTTSGTLFGINIEAKFERNFENNIFSYLGGINIDKIAISYDQAAYILTTENKVYDINQDTPKQIPLLGSDTIKDISVGIFSTDKNIIVIGSNINSRLGLQNIDLNGDLISPERTDPIVVLIFNIKSLAASDTCQLILTDDNQLWGLGKNDYGQLGWGPNFKELRNNKISLFDDDIETIDQIITANKFSAVLVTHKNKKQYVYFSGTIQDYYDTIIEHYFFTKLELKDETPISIHTDGTSLYIITVDGKLLILGLILDRIQQTSIIPEPQYTPVFIDSKEPQYTPVYIDKIEQSVKRVFSNTTNTHKVPDSYIIQTTDNKILVKGLIKKHIFDSTLTDDAFLSRFDQIPNDFKGQIKHMYANSNFIILTTENDELFGIGNIIPGTIHRKFTRYKLNTKGKIIQITGREKQIFLLTDKHEIIVTGINDDDLLGTPLKTVYKFTKLDIYFPIPIRQIITTTNTTILLQENNQIYTLGAGYNRFFIEYHDEQPIKTDEFVDATPPFKEYLKIIEYQAFVRMKDQYVDIQLRKRTIARMRQIHTYYDELTDYLISHIIEPDAWNISSKFSYYGQEVGIDFGGIKRQVYNRIGCLLEDTRVLVKKPEINNRLVLNRDYKLSDDLIYMMDLSIFVYIGRILKKGLIIEKDSNDLTQTQTNSFNKIGKPLSYLIYYAIKFGDVPKQDSELMFVYSLDNKIDTKEAPDLLDAQIKNLSLFSIFFPHYYINSTDEKEIKNDTYAVISKAKKDYDINIKPEDLLDAENLDANKKITDILNTDELTKFLDKFRIPFLKYNIYELHTTGMYKLLVVGYYFGISNPHYAPVDDTETNKKELRELRLRLEGILCDEPDFLETFKASIDFQSTEEFATNFIQAITEISRGELLDAKESSELGLTNIDTQKILCNILAFWSGSSTLDPAKKYEVVLTNVEGNCGIFAHTCVYRLDFNNCQNTTTNTIKKMLLQSATEVDFTAV